VDALIPTNQAYTLLVSRYKERLSGLCRVLAEDFEKTRRLSDKVETMRLADELGIPHPRTAVLDDAVQVERLAAEMTWPVVLKARRGFGATDVWYARDASELAGIFFEITKGPAGDGLVVDRSRLLAQEFIPGELHDVCAFAVEGRLVGGLTQRRIVTVPRRGGWGIVNITTREEELLKHARRLVERVCWTGPMLIDFRVDARDGRPRLLEVNPRFWGTTWLTIAAGLNYPRHFLQHAFGEPVNCPDAYEVGLMARWPLTELTSVFERPFTPRELARRLGGFGARTFNDNCVSDIALSDFAPTALHALLWTRKMALAAGAKIRAVQANRTSTGRSASASGSGRRSFSLERTEASCSDGASRVNRD
jgi:hypothetical protein